MSQPTPGVDWVGIWRRMLLIRRFEELLVTVGHETDGWYHTGIGQEGTAVALADVLTPTDMSNTTHRNHAHALARGVPPAALFAEIFGRATGVNGGFGGSMHTVSPAHGIVVNSAMVGGSVPAMVGAALASKLRGRDDVAVACFGDGGITEGAVYESFCLASLWQVPILFLCENDRIAEMTFDRATGTVPTREVADIARPFDIATRSVDGTDVHMLRFILAEAAERARVTRRPAFIEVRTYAWPGKSTDPTVLPGGPTDVRIAWSASAHDDGTSAWQSSRDPLIILLRHLLAGRVLDRERALQIDAEVTSVVDAALDEARNSPWPDPPAELATASSRGARS